MLRLILTQDIIIGPTSACDNVFYSTGTLTLILTLALSLTLALALTLTQP